MDQVVNATLDASVDLPSSTLPTFVRSTLFKSDDGGATWGEVFTSLAAYDFAVGGGNGMTIAVLDDEGVKISKDGGANFRLVEELAGEESEDFYWNTVQISRNGEFIALASEQSYYFAVSSDAGESFDQLPVDPR